MKNCIIFCAGGFNGLEEAISAEDFIIAADGGVAHAQILGLTPHIILGDFDSLGYIPKDAHIFPREKDDTDSMLAVREGLRRGYTRFLIYGSLDGERLDHTVANFQTLKYLADHGAQGYCIGKNQIATVIKNSALTFPPEASGIFSVFCMGADAQGVTLQGLQYNIDNTVLTAGFPLGVSNRFTGQTASVAVKNGSLLLMYSRGVQPC